MAAASSPTVLPFILASASPRRQALLSQAGFTPERVIAPDVDERPKEAELPRAYALRLALLKAESVAKKMREAEDLPAALLQAPASIRAGIIN